MFSRKIKRGYMYYFEDLIRRFDELASNACLQISYTHIWTMGLMAGITTGIAVALIINLTNNK